MLTNLYVRTEYTLMDSLISIDKYIEFALKNELKQIVKCDTTMAGTFEFVDKCKKNGIKPIVGMEINLSSIHCQTTSFLLFAKSQKGLYNLFKLSSFLEANDNGLTDFDLLTQYSSDIRFVSLDNKEITHNIARSKNVLNKYQNSFDFYMGINPRNNDYEFLVNLANENRCKTIMVLPTKYFLKKERLAYNCLRSVKFKNYLEDNVLTGDESFESYDEFSSNEEFSEHVKYLDDFSHVELEFKKENTLPVFDPSYKSDEYLRALAFKGLEKRLSEDLTNLNVYLDRLDYELNIISEMNFSDYFLNVYDIVLHAKKKLNILVGPGRGSAVGSLVCYCLGITNIDPLKYGLIFERFLNPSRSTLPDIDIDIDGERREDLIKYIKNRFGQERVAGISIYKRFKLNTVLFDVAQSLRMTKLQIDFLKKNIPNSSKTVEDVRLDAKIMEVIQQNSKFEDLFKYAEKMEGLIMSISQHLVGVIITENNLKNYVPLTKISNSTTYVSQFDKDEIEKLGIPKIDILHSKTLSRIQKTLTKIKATHNIDISLDKLNLKDQSTYNLLSAGETVGLFQLNTSIMTNMIKKINVNSIEDIAIVLSINRSGALHQVPEYIEYKNNPMMEKKTDPIYDEICKDTEGFLVYQEQVIQIFSRYAGYTYAEADLIRQLMKSKDEEAFAAERSKFISRATARGHEESFLGYLFDHLAKFAEYGYNKSHAIAYALIVYYTAYLKVHYPHIYISILMNESNNIDPELYKNECSKLGVKILNPNINLSTNENTFNDKTMLLSFNSIKGLTQRNIQDLLNERNANGPFVDYYDFIERTMPFLNVKNVQSLIFSSSLDDFGKTKKFMDRTIYRSRRNAEFADVLDISGFNDTVDSEEYEETILEEKEFEIFGFNLKYNFITKYAKIIKEHGLVRLSQIDDFSVKECVVKVISVNVRLDKYKKNMAFLTIDDGETRRDAVIFNKVYEALTIEIEKGKCYLFRLKKPLGKEKFEISRVAGINI